MMRHAISLNLGLATLFVVPAVTLRGQEPLDIVGRLAATVRALEDLAGLQERLSGGSGGVSEVLAATEAPIGDARARDESLTRLRGETAGLQMRYDEILAEGHAVGLGALPFVGPDAEQAETWVRSVATTGLDDQQRAALSRLPEGGFGSMHSTGDRRSFEDEPGYTVDAVAQGRLLTRAGRYDEALVLLQDRPEPEARFWLARCYEELGRREDALALLVALEGDEQAGSFQRRAKYERGFLQIKAQIEQRRGTRGGGR